MSAPRPIKKCPYCLQEIDAIAVMCPKCRRALNVAALRQTMPPKSGLARHPVFVVLLILFIIIPVTITAVLLSVNTNNPDPTSPPNIIEMKNMIADYDANQISADSKYKGSKVQLSGYVDNISKDFLGSPYISINPTNEQYYFGTYVQCFVNESEAVKATNGKQITVIGKVSGMTVGIIGVDDCTVR